MPRGGHSRCGPAIQDAATRRTTGARTRPRHRAKGDVGTTLETCAPPPGLPAAARTFWRYYATLLQATGRLTAQARDCLANYCEALAIIASLRRQLHARRRAVLQSAIRKELRQWQLVARLLESDLLLNPASAVRAPRPRSPEEAADPFAEFVSTSPSPHVDPH